MTAMPDDAALSAEERAELERLRAEVADLRSASRRRASSGRTTTCCGSSRHLGSAGVRWSPPCLIVIGCILAPLSVVAVWAKNQVTDTDRYVTTVAPLARDPAIQTAVADKITAEIFARLDVKAITNQAVDALANRGLPPLVATQLHALVRADVQRSAELRSYRSRKSGSQRCVCRRLGDR